MIGPLLIAAAAVAAGDADLAFARACYRDAAYAEAALEYRRWLFHHGARRDADAALTGLGLAYLRLARPADAAATLGRVGRPGPVVQLALGRARLGMGDRDGAAACFRALPPAEAGLWLGRLAAEAGDWGAARDGFQAAGAVDLVGEAAARQADRPAAPAVLLLAGVVPGGGYFVQGRPREGLTSMALTMALGTLATTSYRQGQPLAAAAWAGGAALFWGSGALGAEREARRAFRAREGEALGRVRARTDAGWPELP